MVTQIQSEEDDGQGDEDADEVRGGPNSDYSLSEARRNFDQFRVMYAPERDQRITGRDSDAEYEAKGLLMDVFDRLCASHPGQAPSGSQCWPSRITRLRAGLKKYWPHSTVRRVPHKRGRKPDRRR